jgi:tRNA U34 5-methylaminomethyl-2-thiouridine-forming methyltransferase MnmC
LQLLIKPMSDWIPQATQDGSYTFFSETFGETFHSLQGAQAEAFQKFAVVTQLHQRAQSPNDAPLRLLDVCYGLGYNSAAALAVIGEANPDRQTLLYALELDATVPIGALSLPPIWPPTVQTILTDLAHTHRSQRGPLTAELLIGDARQTIQTLIAQGFQADAIFLDPFSPKHCPQLWTVEFLGLVAQCLAPGGRLATYSRSAAVRSALQLAGLQIGTVPLPPDLDCPAHEWSQGTVAAWQSEGLEPLSAMEREHLATRAAVPLRDPTLADAAAAIQARHRLEQQQAQVESTSQWRRRWGI